MNIKIAPSLMCMDLLNVKKQIEILDNYCDYYHADIMDGHFVKNICLSIDFIKQLRTITTKPIDCHLMTTNPENYIDELIKAKVDYISLHVETINGQAFRLIDKIKSANLGFGIVLNPETNFSCSLAYLSLVDLITIMTVDPGFAGQKFIENSVFKIKEIKEYKKNKNFSYKIAVDGSCNKKTYSTLKNAGAECFIVGSSGLFSLDDDLEVACNKMMNDVKNAV